MAEPAVRVEGLKELNAAFRKLGDKEVPKALRVASKSAAVEVASVAASRVPRRSGKLAGSLRPVGLAKGAAVRAGGASVPYAGWIEFGGTIRHKTDAWSSTRPFIRQGRYIFPTALAMQPAITATFEIALSEALRSFH